MRKKMPAAALLIIFCLLVCSAALAAPGVGDAAPQIMVHDEGGQTVGLLTYDKVTVLNFWATWCPPCRKELPELQKFYNLKREEIYFYAITKEPKSTVQNFMQKNSYTLPLLFDSNGQVGAMYGITVIPTTFIIDTKGIVRQRILGTTSADKLMEILAQIQ